MAVPASVTKLPGALNLYFRPGDEFELLLRFKNKDGTPVDITIHTKVANIYSKTTGFTDTFLITPMVGESSGIVLLLTKDQTKGLDIYTELNWYLKFDDKTTVLAGTVYPVEDP
jgi:hypothetical protein